MIFLRAVPEVTVTVLLFVTIGNNDFNFSPVRQRHGGNGEST